VKVNSTLPAGLRVITNTARIRTTYPGEDTSDNLAMDVDPVTTVPTLALNPFYDSSTPYPGKVITYTLRYTNTSAMDTIGVVITATRPAWLASSPPGWVQNGASDERWIGDLPAGQSGQVTYLVTLPVTYTPSMNAFILTFTIQDGGPGGLPIAHDSRTALIGVPDLSITQVIVPPSVTPGQKFTATLIISNSGLGRACNPKAEICGGFWVDAFIDPTTPPPSYPFQSYGNPFAGVPPIDAGKSISVNIPDLVFTSAQRPVLYFKIDNFNCASNNACLPDHSLGGLVPEYNESNNVSGPINVSGSKVYLPMIRRNSK
jgi:uncharacterized repeat protein (TIGR01451 family)